MTTFREIPGVDTRYQQVRYRLEATSGSMCGTYYGLKGRWVAPEDAYHALTRYDAELAAKYLGLRGVTVQIHEVLS